MRFASVWTGRLAVTVCTAVLATSLAVPSSAAAQPPGAGLTSVASGPGAAARGDGLAKPAVPAVPPYAPVSGAELTRQRQAAQQLVAPSSEQVEDVSARTERSRTWLDRRTGSRRTEVSASRLNFRDAKGAWQQVDPSLVDAASKPGGAEVGWQNAAGAFDVSLPVQAGGPVRLSMDADRWVSVQLSPAGGPAGAAAKVLGLARGKIQGKGKVQYADVLPSTDLTLSVTGDGLKEEVTFGSQLAVAALPGGVGAPSLTYALTAGAGLRPVQTGNQISMQDGSGTPVFVLPAPFMDDAAGAHSDDVGVTLSDAGARGWELTVAPSAAWLADPARVFPVVLDPTIGYPSPVLGCSLSSAAPTTSACSAAQLPLSADTAGPQRRAVLRFDTLLDVVPADAQITSAHLAVQVANNPAGPTGAAASVDVRELTSPATSAATWNTRNGSTPWTTAGGDRAALVSARGQLVSNGSYQNLNIAEVMQRWVSGTSNHHGFVLEKTSAVAGGAPVLLGSPTSGQAPALYVDWTQRVGDRKGNSTVVDVDVTDRTSVKINPASGNAAVTTQELTIAGAGIDLNVAHTMNSLDTYRLGLLGNGWTSSLDARLEPVDGRAMLLIQGDGAQWVFHQAIDGSWTRPDGLDSDLKANTDGTFTLTDRRSKVAQTFLNVVTAAAPSYRLAKIRDRNGNQISFTYDPSARTPFNNARILRSVTDTRGRTLSVTNYGYWVSSLTDPANRTTGYTLTGNNNMTSFRNTGGGSTGYEYDNQHRVTAVVAPGGQRTQLAYDAQGRITSLTQVNASAQNSVWGLSYTPFDRANGAPATKTTVTDPNGNVSTYTSDGRGQIGTAVDARGSKRTGTFTQNSDPLTGTGATVGAGGSAQTSTNTYDSAGASSAAATWNLSSSRIPTGAGSTLAYGTGARLYDVTRSTDARGTQTSYDYDSAGNPTRSTRGGVTTTSLYQGNTDPAYGGTVNCGPTVNGAVTATKPGSLCETRDGAYTPGANAASTTAHRVAYRYDTLGQLVTMLPGTPSAQKPVSYEYDSLSRLLRVTDGKGQVTYYGSDRMDRVTYTQYGDGSVDVSDYGPEGGNGRLIATGQYPSGAPQGTPASQFTVHGRDDLGRLQHVDAPQGYIDLDYDRAGNLTRYADTGGATGYGYNTANQLTSTALPGGSCAGQSLSSPGPASSLCVLFGVDNDGRRTLTRYPGGHTQTAALDNTGRPTNLTGTSAGSVRMQLGYTYTDPAAPASSSNPNRDTTLISKITEQGGTATSYGYDPLERLTAATTRTTAGAVSRYEGFCYDGAGNRTKTLNTAGGATCTTGTPASTASYNGGNEQTAATGTTATGTSLTGSSFSYDANGNQTASRATPGLTTSYDARDAATSFMPTGGAAIVQTYASNGNGQRLTSGPTSFQPSPLSPAPAWAKTGSTSTWAVRDPDGTLLALRSGTSPTTASVYYPFTDHLGSVRALIRADGTVANTYTYTAYGLTLTANETFPQPYRYAQGYTDTNTGLIKLGIRYYDPTHGRFTQTDPTGQDPHYTYAANNPANGLDPSGAGFIDIVGSILNGVANGNNTAGAANDAIRQSAQKYAYDAGQVARRVAAAAKRLGGRGAAIPFFFFDACTFVTVPTPSCPSGPQPVA